MATDAKVLLYPQAQTPHDPQPLSKYGGLTVWPFKVTTGGVRNYIEIPGIREVLFWRAMQESGDNNQDPGAAQAYFLTKPADMPTGNDNNYTNTGSLTVTTTAVANASGTTAFNTVSAGTYLINPSFYPHWLYVNPGTATEQSAPIASITNANALVLKAALITDGTYTSWAIRYKFKPFTMLFATAYTWDVLVVYRRL